MTKPATKKYLPPNVQKEFITEINEEERLTKSVQKSQI